MSTSINSSHSLNSPILIANFTSPNVSPNSISDLNLNNESNLISNNNYFNYKSMLKEFINTTSNNFSLIHLNINSLVNKFDDIYFILSLDYDLIAFNETKLDDSVPNNFNVNSKYNLVILDRNRNGDGIALFIKKEYKFSYSLNFEHLECIHLQLKIHNSDCNFLIIYKPPKMNEKLFINELDEILCQLDRSLPLFIIGDLNIDLKSSKGQKLLQFMKSNDLSNFVDDYTRVASKYNNNINEFTISRSLIDVIIHNKNIISKTKVVPCPFSDHCFVIAELTLQRAKNVSQSIEVRNLNIKNLNRITNEISMLDFGNLYNYSSVNQIWSKFQDSILKITNKTAPLHYISFNKKSCLPWYDKELYLLKKKRDAAHSNFKVRLD